MTPSSQPRIRLEICTASVADCRAAEQGGADRIELNQALALGGLTPSLGLLRHARAAVYLPLIAMVRPRPGGFCYDTHDFDVMCTDARLLVKNGADGLAFGILQADGTLDVTRCRALMAAAGKTTFVFHRAFDVVPDPLATLEQLVDLGFHRILTSGQEASAYNGAANLRAYREAAAGRIEILPAGGLNPFTVADVVRRSGCDQIHAGLTTSQTDLSVGGRPQVSFGGGPLPDETRFRVTDEAKVRAMRALLGSS